MALIPWSELDVLTSEEQIHSLLRVKGVKGRRCTSMGCPIAVATGWIVGPKQRWLTSYQGTMLLSRLTKAEELFIASFDDGMYPDLEAL